MNRLISVAPMMDWTDTHCRYFLRLISKQVLLYTEMVTTGAIIHGDKNRFLKFNQEEHPIAIQLGGSDLSQLGECAAIVSDYNYDEINLNVGCPSDRVQSGKFGACLMAEPDLVAECVAAMIKNTSLPVTVKTRLGIDDRDSYEALCHFIETVHSAGCETFILHARKAWLKGLSPRENREIPPLQYDRVHRIKKDYPELEIILNGGIKNADQISEQCQLLDGVMIGREAYHNPYFLADFDQKYYGRKTESASRVEILNQYIEYIDRQTANGIYLKHMTRHILGLFHNQPNARKWRRYLSENAYEKTAGSEVITKALAAADYL